MPMMDVCFLGMFNLLYPSDKLTISCILSPLPYLILIDKIITMRSLLFLFFFVSQTLLATAQIKHVEPLDWWVGMKDPRLQIMVNGPGIGSTLPVIDYPGVHVIKVTKGDSENYLFIELEITPSTKPGKFAIQFTRNGAVTETILYTLHARKKDPLQFKGFNSEDVICLITPDRFANGDPSNDVVKGMREQKIARNEPGGRHGGDIRGLIDNLDYFSKMGYTAIWPQPLMENNMAAYSYHGYSITDHYKVDPRFGTLEEYKELSQKAKARGIKIIYDAVLNHIGAKHWWMEDLPFKDWINYADSMIITSHVRTVNQDPNASKYDRELMTRGWFVESMPDLNGANSFLSEYMIQNNIWLIETLELGGIRLDTYGYSIKPFLNDWSCRIMNEYPNFNLVGEEWSLNPLITSYWQKGKVNSDTNASCLGSVMDFPLQSALVEALKQKDRTIWGKGMNIVYEALANDFVYANPNSILVFGDNHDMDRVYTQLGNDLPLTQMAITLLLTVRGIPQLYYGTEVLLQNTENPGNHGYIRTDMPGGWTGDVANAFTGKGLSNDQLSMQRYTQGLLQWRKNNKIITSGKTLHFAPFNDVYVYFRYIGTEKVMVVLNRNEKAVTIDPVRFQEILLGNKNGKNVLTNELVNIDKPFQVAAKSALVLEIDPIR